MKRNLYLLLAIILLLAFESGSVVCSQQMFRVTNSSVIGYLEYLPEDYHANSDKYPVVIFLHGIGERGTNTTDIERLRQSVQQVAKIGPPMHVKNGKQFPFILISPQLKNNYGNWPSDYVLEVINDVKTYLRIDEKRIYLTGLSLGGGGAWWTAQDYPELFAALAPVCGGRNTPSKACSIATENMPVWAFHGDKDTIVPLSRTVNMVTAINTCEPAPSPLAQISIYAGVAHDSWTMAYDTDGSIHNPTVYEWMLSFTNTINRGNKLPTADAGSDKTISAGRIELAGSGVDPDGRISGYRWHQLSGPAPAALENVHAPTLYAIDLKPGKYTFAFHVTDEDGNSDTDYVEVKVLSANTAPIANAGPDTTVYISANAVTLSGTASDADGLIRNYSWSKVSGPTVDLAGVDTPHLTLRNLLLGSYLFRLTVRDDKGGISYDDVRVHVKNSIAPVADAGTDEVVLLPSRTATLSGRGEDADGVIVSFQWKQKSGPLCVMEGVHSPVLNISELISGSYIFELTVADNSGLKKSDEVTVHVTLPPVVDAGRDISLELPDTTITLNGHAYDRDGTIASYRWMKYSGPLVTLENDSTPTLTVSALREGTYVFSLTVADNLKATATDLITVTVKKGILATGSGTSGPEKITRIPGGDSGFNFSTVDGPQPVFNRMTAFDLENCLVAIFTDTGRRIFSGTWSVDKYQEVFRRNGLYLYHIIKNGKRIDTGKIYITR
jgi:dienelactone hydrolase